MATHTVTATKLKNNLGAYLEAAIAAPVFIEKSGRATAVLLSRAQYDLLQQYEDFWWAMQAQRAAREGFLGIEDTARALDALTKAKDDEAC